MITPRADLFIPTGAGAKARLVQAKLAETLSFEDFGAVGNGSTDDTAAIVATYAAQASSGKPIRLAGGKTYATATGEILHSYAGGVVDGNGSTIKYTGTSRVLAVMLFAGQRTEVSGITFDANHKAFFGAYLHSSNQSYRYCNFYYALSDGVTGHVRQAANWYEDYLTANGVEADDANGYIVDVNEFTGCDFSSNGYAYRSKNALPWNVNIVLGFTHSSTTVTLVSGGSGDLRNYLRPGDSLENVAFGLSGFDRTGLVTAVAQTSVTLETAYPGTTANRNITGVLAGWRCSGFNFDSLLHPSNDTYATGTVAGTEGNDYITGTGTDFGSDEFKKLRGGDPIVVYGQLYTIKNALGSGVDGLAQIVSGTQRIYINGTLQDTFSGANYLICHGDGIHGHRSGDNGIWSIYQGMARGNAGYSVCNNALYGWVVTLGNRDFNGAGMGIGVSGGAVLKTAFTRPYIEGVGVGEAFILGVASSVTITEPSIGESENLICILPGASPTFVMTREGTLTTNGYPAFSHYAGGALDKSDLWRDNHGRWRSGDSSLNTGNLLNAAIDAVYPLSNVTAGSTGTVTAYITIGNMLTDATLSSYRVSVTPVNPTGGMAVTPPAWIVSSITRAGTQLAVEITVVNNAGTTGACDFHVVATN